MTPRELLRATPGEELRRLAGLLPPAVLVAGAAWPGSPAAVVGVAVLAALLAVLADSGWRLAGLLVPGRPVATRASAAVVLGTALATVPATLLGHAGLLYPGPFLLWGAALGLLSRLLPAPAPAAAASEPPDDAPSAPPPGPPAADSPAPGATRLRAVERTLAVATVLILAATALLQLRTSRYQPPGAFGFDDLSYHLAAVATWADRGDLAMVKFSYGDPSTPFYPIVGELVSWVLLAPFGDLDVAARWSQLPFALATLIVMLSLGERLGMRRRSVVPALALYWSLERVFPMLALGAGNDHATAFFALASVDGLVELARRRTVGAGLYAGGALGLLVGTKYLGVLYLPVLGGVYLVSLVAGSTSKRARSAGRDGPGFGLRGFLPEVVAVGAAAVAGGYTYLRNAVAVGNPLFPAPLTLAGREILPGWEHATLAFRRSLPEFAIDLPEFLFREDLWGPAAPWLLVPAAFAAPAAALAAPRPVRPAPGARALQSAILLLPAGLFAVFLFLVHDHRDVRYFFAGIAVAALGWGFLADRLERAGGARGFAPAAATALRSAACVAAVAAVTLPREHGRPAPWVFVAVGLVAGLWAAGWWNRLEPRVARLVHDSRHRRILVALVAAGLLAAIPVAAHVAHRYPERKHEHRPVARFLDEEAGPGGATVAYVGLNRPYLLWGNRLQNRVVIVPTTEELDERLYRWGGSATFPFRVQGRFHHWSDNLDRLGVSYVVVVRLGGEDPERGWMLRHPERFTLAFIYEHPELYVRTEVWAYSG